MSHLSLSGYTVMDLTPEAMSVFCEAEPSVSSLTLQRASADSQLRLALNSYDFSRGEALTDIDSSVGSLVVYLAREGTRDYGTLIGRVELSCYVVTGSICHKLALEHIFIRLLQPNRLNFEYELYNHVHCERIKTLAGHYFIVYVIDSSKAEELKVRPQVQLIDLLTDEKKRLFQASQSEDSKQNAYLVYVEADPRNHMSLHDVCLQKNSRKI